MVSDAELVTRSRQRDATAFGLLVARHQQLVFGVALARCGDPALAEDVAQDAFVAAWRDIDRLRDVDRVGSWVAGIARNLAATAARKRRSPSVAAPEPVRTPEDEALRREDRELLQQALADIPDEHREALVLFYLHGQSVAQIAAGLGVREDLIKQRLSRGRRALRDSVTSRVESALARVRPSTAFGTGVIAALSTLTAKQALAAGEVVTFVSGTKKLVAAVVLVFVLAGVAWFVARRSDTTKPPVTAGSVVAPPATTPPTQHVRRMRDPAMREPLLAQIRAAKERRLAEAQPATQDATVEASAPEAKNQEYLARSMREVETFVAECYAEAKARDPKLGGTVTANLTIEAEPGVGGVVGDSAIDDAASTLTDPVVRECVQQTMYALQLEPPADGGVYSVRYSFVLQDGLDQALITGPEK